LETNGLASTFFPPLGTWGRDQKPPIIGDGWWSQAFSFSAEGRGRKVDKAPPGIARIFEKECVMLIRHFHLLYPPPCPCLKNLGVFPLTGLVIVCLDIPLNGGAHFPTVSSRFGWGGHSWPPAALTLQPCIIFTGCWNGNSAFENGWGPLPPDAAGYTAGLRRLGILLSSAIYNHKSIL